MQLEHLDVYFLKIPFNVVFRHASAERDSTVVCTFTLPYSVSRASGCISR